MKPKVTVENLRGRIASNNGPAKPLPEQKPEQQPPVETFTASNWNAFVRLAVPVEFTSLNMNAEFVVTAEAARSSSQA